MTKRPPTEAALPLTLGPGLFTATAFEHAEGAAGGGIQHRPDNGGLSPASIARRDWIGLVVGKDFVLELATHDDPPCGDDSLRESLNNLTIVAHLDH
jgi:hypothetical protein